MITYELISESIRKTIPEEKDLVHLMLTQSSENDLRSSIYCEMEKRISDKGLYMAKDWIPHMIEKKEENHGVRHDLAVVRDTGLGKQNSAIHITEIKVDDYWWLRNSRKPKHIRNDLLKIERTIKSGKHDEIAGAAFLYICPIFRLKQGVKTFPTIGSVLRQEDRTKWNTKMSKINLEKDIEATRGRIEDFLEDLTLQHWKIRDVGVVEYDGEFRGVQLDVHYWIFERTWD